jgi:hypothetical protein
MNYELMLGKSFLWRFGKNEIRQRANNQAEIEYF